MRNDASGDCGAFAGVPRIGDERDWRIAESGDYRGEAEGFANHGPRPAGEGGARGYVDPEFAPDSRDRGQGSNASKFVGRRVGGGTSYSTKLNLRDCVCIRYVWG